MIYFGMKRLKAYIYIIYWGIILFFFHQKGQFIIAIFWTIFRLYCFPWKFYIFYIFLIRSIFQIDLALLYYFFFFFFFFFALYYDALHLILEERQKALSIW
jgi:hypothetical protein